MHPNVHCSTVCKSSLNVINREMGKEDVYTYIYAMEYYSTIKKNEIMLFAITWMDPEILILSEVSQTEKEIYMISIICGI